MSNPAVTKLVRDKIGGLSFWMDDNIGESIHIHLADFRLDLSAAKLKNLSEELSDTITGLVNIDGFDCQNIDPVFLSRMLYPLLMHLTDIKIDYVNVGDLIACYDKSFGLTKYVNIKKARAVKALQGDSRENDDMRGSHHVGQTSGQRLDAMRGSIAANGYPYNNQYIIVYGDQMLIRDGQHRASCIYFENGDVKIPIMRMYFDDEELIKYQPGMASQIINKIKKEGCKNIVLLPIRVLRKIKRVMGKSVIKLKKICLRSKINDMEKVFFS